MGKRILITGGTVFVSKFAAEYFVKRGYEVSVLNRGSRPQVSGVEWICADRNQLNGVLQGKHFDHVLDITAYTKEDVKNLLAELNEFSTYILISSSAVYPETLQQPFSVGHFLRTVQYMPFGSSPYSCVCSRLISPSVSS